LCLERQTLVKSHIIPKFLWKPMKTEEGYYFPLSSDPSNPEYKSQKEYTEHMLCSNCDNFVLQRYEDKLSRIFLDTLI